MLIVKLLSSQTGNDNAGKWASMSNLYNCMPGRYNICYTLVHNVKMPIVFLYFRLHELCYFVLEGPMAWIDASRFPWLLDTTLTVLTVLQWSCHWILWKCVLPHLQKFCWCGASLTKKAYSCFSVSKDDYIRSLSCLHCALVSASNMIYIIGGKEEL